MPRPRSSRLYLLRGSSILGPRRRQQETGRTQCEARLASSVTEVVNDLRAVGADGRVDVAVRVRKPIAALPSAKKKGDERAIDCELIYDPQSAASRDAYNWVERC